MSRNYLYNTYATSPTDDPFVSKDASVVEQAFQKLPAESIKTLFNRTVASDEEKTSVDNFHATTLPLFMKMYPAYVDNDHNAKLMKHQWQTKFDVETPSLVQLEETFFDLRQAGVLTLNKAAVAKEDAARIAQHHDELIAARKEAEFDPAKAYTMPMEELEARARGWK